MIFWYQCNINLIYLTISFASRNSQLQQTRDLFPSLDIKGFSKIRNTKTRISIDISFLRQNLCELFLCVNDSQYMNSHSIAIQYMEEIEGKRAFSTGKLDRVWIEPILAFRQFTCVRIAGQTCRCISRSSKFLPATYYRSRKVRVFNKRCVCVCVCVCARAAALQSVIFMRIFNIVEKIHIALYLKNLRRNNIYSTHDDIKRISVQAKFQWYFSSKIITYK